MDKISCIIAAFNEYDRIAKVLQAVHNHPKLSEVIVVDDGSIDHTDEVVRQFPNIRLIKQPKNQGKSMAVFTGINNATGNIIFLLDADLVGLTAENITDMVDPVLSGQADIAISIRKNSPWFDRMVGIDYISGERVFLKKLIQGHLNEIPKLRAFGLEVFLNRLIIKNKYRIKIVPMMNVISPLKYKKSGFMAGVKGDFNMMRDIFKTVSVLEAGMQYVRMTRLKVK
ncbi:MAG TPA: glycosyltransferase family 2 protein [Patescibacteria group bacterium]